MTLAFSKDPLFRWIYHESAKYFESFIAGYGGDPFPNQSGFCYSNHCGGALLWLSSEERETKQEFYSLLTRTTTEQKLNEVIRLFEKLDNSHPKEAHLYLTLLARDPFYKEKVVNIVRSFLKVCDTQQLPAYLEATSGGLIEYYRQFDFELLAPVQYGSSPVCYPMVRFPR